MVAKLKGKCPTCRKSYSLDAAPWVYAHLADPTAWPLRVNLPCGHVREEIWPEDFTPPLT